VATAEEPPLVPLSSMNFPLRIGLPFPPMYTLGGLEAGDDPGIYIGEVDDDRDAISGRSWHVAKDLERIGIVDPPTGNRSGRRSELTSYEAENISPLPLLSESSSIEAA
jgi:hypothetical protein